MFIIIEEVKIFLRHIKYSHLFHQYTLWSQETFKGKFDFKASY